MTKAQKIEKQIDDFSELQVDLALKMIDSIANEDFEITAKLKSQLLNAVENLANNIHIHNGRIEHVHVHDIKLKLLENFCDNLYNQILVEDHKEQLNLSVPLITPDTFLT
jgi:hypothetical protein